MVEISSGSPSEEELRTAAGIIRAGGIVAFPTETYYGLAVDPKNDRALSKLYHLKGREKAKPILVLVPERTYIQSLVESTPSCFVHLMDTFWPGALTLVFPARQRLSYFITAGSNTVGIRLSSNSYATRLCKLSGMPITATSANLSGKQAAVTVNEVLENFTEEIDYIVDGGQTPGGKASTVVGFDGNGPVLLRPGVVDFDLILHNVQVNTGRRN